nr:integrase, catalytic region, zinc finger, CCHC-type, peptidase aspartic, catalytic [Tanacetum cinerariifolium]
SIDEGPYKLGTFRETLAESTEGTPQFSPERPRVYSDLNFEEKDRFDSAFWFCDLLLRFGYAFCLRKTLPISKPGCVLCQDVVAFCLKDILRFVSRSLRFVSRTSCVLPQDILRLVSRTLRFVSRPNTRLPMLDRTDFASWQQRIRLFCWGKENGVNILKSIDEGPYRMGTVREALAEST